MYIKQNILKWIWAYMYYLNPFRDAGNAIFPHFYIDLYGIFEWNMKDS